MSFRSFAALEALAGHATTQSFPLEGNVNCIALFNHEEIGSVSSSGAASSLIPILLERLSPTSRDPSSKLLQFAKVCKCVPRLRSTTHIVPGTQEMRLVFPNSHRINRGNYVVKELADACRANEVSDLIVLHEHRGVPGSLVRSYQDIPQHLPLP